MSEAEKFQSYLNDVLIAAKLGDQDDVYKAMLANKSAADYVKSHKAK
jgi:hypothetical protein